jgi:hypothetical protein
MSKTNVLWGDPLPEDLPPAPKPKYKKKRQLASQLPTDILVWLRQNEPNTFEELMDLRLALYSRQTKGQYQISRRGQTMMGEERYVVVGPADPLLLLSDKARHFLLRNLCRLRRRNGWPPIRN